MVYKCQGFPRKTMNMQVLSSKSRGFSSLYNLVKIEIVAIMTSVLFWQSFCGGAVNTKAKRVFTNHVKLKDSVHRKNQEGGLMGISDSPSVSPLVFGTHQSPSFPTISAPAAPSNSTWTPSQNPTSTSSTFPTKIPSLIPSVYPSSTPSTFPTKTPSLTPSVYPSSTPSSSPTEPENCEDNLALDFTIYDEYNLDVVIFDNENITTLNLWENVTSTFIEEFYLKTDAEEGSSVTLFEASTTINRWFFIPGDVDQKKDSVSIYWSICLRYRLSNEESELDTSDLISFPFSRQSWRNEYLDGLNAIRDFQNITGVKRLEFALIPDYPSVSPSDRPTNYPSSMPSVTYITAGDTWSALRQNTVLSCFCAIGLLILFEVCRRAPIISDVFDRRRSSCPNNTPPPLMRGYVLEWLRLNTSPSYTVWSKKMFEQNMGYESKHQRVGLKAIAHQMWQKDRIIEEPLPGECMEEVRDDLSKWSEDLSEEVEQEVYKSAEPSQAYNAEQLADQKARQVLSIPNDNDIDLIEEGHTMDEVKKIRKQKLGSNFTLGKVNIDSVCVAATDESQLRMDSNMLKKIQIREDEENEAPLKKTKETRFSLPFLRRFDRSVKSNTSKLQAEPEKESISLQQSRRKRIAELNNSTTARTIDSLSPTDRELLRCIGLDTFCMLRILRMGFIMSLVSSIAGIIVLFPTFANANFDGMGTATGGGVPTVGYYEYTYNKLRNKSDLFWVVLFYALAFYAFILRLLWEEWKFFINLRFEFLSARSIWSEMNELSIVQYRNSCLVDYVPREYRSNVKLFEYFDAIFPGQVKRAEILVNAQNLSELIDRRKAYVKKYENTFARHVYVKRQYERRMKEMEHKRLNSSILCFFLNCLPKDPKRPTEPLAPIDNEGRLRKGRLRLLQYGNKVVVKALPYYLQQIRELNKRCNDEADRLIEARKRMFEMELDRQDRVSIIRFPNLSQNVVSSAISNFFKIPSSKDDDQRSSRTFANTAFVEFKTLTAKESAIQCNVSGTSDFISCRAAPLPNDIQWSNMDISQRIISERKWRVHLMLMVAIIFWTPVVTFISNFGDPETWKSLGVDDRFLPSEDNEYTSNLMEGFVPVIILESLMKILVAIIKAIALQYIQFKTKSEAEEFVMLWHFMFRLINVLSIIVSGGIIKTFEDGNVTENARLFAAGVAENSEFFLDNAVVGAGIESLMELAQLPTMIQTFITIKCVKIEAKSERELEKLDETEEIYFAENMPEYLFYLLAVMVYAPIVPLVTCACTIYFFMTYKVWHHQALFVYAQKHEGGGRLMYLINRMIFTSIYFSIIVLTIIFTLHDAFVQAFLFGPIALITTLAVDYKVQHLFVEPSSTLALSIARQLDDLDQLALERAKKFRELKIHHLDKEGVTVKAKKETNANFGDEKYLYRQPILDKVNWETKPRPYRGKYSK